MLETNQHWPSADQKNQKERTVPPLWTLLELCCSFFFFFFCCLTNYYFFLNRPVCFNETLQTCVKETIGRRQTLMDRKNGNDPTLKDCTPSKTPSSTPSKTSPSKTTSSTQAVSSNRLHMGHGAVVQPVRDRSVASRSRQPNRYSRKLHHSQESSWKIL